MLVVGPSQAFTLGQVPSVLQCGGEFPMFPMFFFPSPQANAEESTLPGVWVACEVLVCSSLSSPWALLSGSISTRVHPGSHTVLFT